MTISYTYDALHRLTAADYSDGRFYHYTYSAVGNRMSEQSLYSTINYTYDEANRLTSVDGVAYTWDNNGNLLSDGVNTYTYDSANRLISIVNPQSTITYRYDGLGDRLQEIVNGVTTTFTLDIASGLTQVLSDGTNDYLYGVDRIAQVSATDTEFFLGDALGSVRQLADAGGVITLAKDYDPFGNAGSSLGAGTTPYGYTGEQQDNGLVFLRARYYVSGVGRFQSRDTWGGDNKSPMSYNGWMYAYSNPIVFTDPNGHDVRDSEDRCYLDSRMKNTWFCKQVAILTDMSNNFSNANYSAKTSPPLISFSPVVAVNLASPLDIPVDQPNAQVIGGNGHFCGQVSLTMIEETILGVGTGRLADIIKNINVYDKGIDADTLAKQAVKDLPNWQAAVYSYNTVAKYNYDPSAGKDVITSYIFNGTTDWWGNGSIIAPLFKKMLELQHYVIVFTETTNNDSWAKLVNQNPGDELHAEHWVVLRGMSRQWDEQDEDSIWNWVMINNPFGNREEYYPWWYFKQSMGVYPYTNPYVLEIYPKSSSAGWQSIMK